MALRGAQRWRRSRRDLPCEWKTRVAQSGYQPERMAPDRTQNEATSRATDPRSALPDPAATRILSPRDPHRTPAEHEPGRQWLQKNKTITATRRQDHHQARP